MLFRTGIMVFTAGLILFALGLVRSLFWYGDPKTAPLVLPWGFTLVPGATEKVSGLILIAAGAAFMVWDYRK